MSKPRCRDGREAAGEREGGHEVAVEEEEAGKECGGADEGADDEAAEVADVLGQVGGEAAEGDESPTGAAQRARPPCFRTCKRRERRRRASVTGEAEVGR